MTKITRLYRHPIKAHGWEAVERTLLTKGQAMPWDRVWGVAHEAAESGDGWIRCANFNRGAKSPALMAIEAQVDEAQGTITLSSPDAENITINPDLPDDAAKLINWSQGLTEEGRAAPARIHRADVALTDSPFPSIAILSEASLRVLSQRAGREIDPRRFRGNIWINGDALAPFEEFELLGREITIGAARLKVEERITRCRATHVSPESGRLDTPILDILEEAFEHRDFGIYASVIETGDIALGDAVSW